MSGSKGVLAFFVLFLLASAAVAQAQLPGQTPGQSRPQAGQTPPSPPSQAAKETTLAMVKARGHLLCGVNGELPGFSKADSKGQWSGFDVDFCRALAAAALDDAARVKFVVATASDRFELLQRGAIDVLVRNTTITLRRATGDSGLRYAAITFIDGQAFAVTKQSGITTLGGLANGRICMTRNTTYEQNTVDWFAGRRLTMTPVLFDRTEPMIEAFLGGSCDAITQQSTGLATALIQTGRAADFLVLPEIVSKEPHGPWVRAGDDQWLDIVRWTHNARLEAEELGITSRNVDAMKASRLLGIRRLLGLEPGNGQQLGLDEEWAYRAIKQTGNYGESYERFFGEGSPLRFAHTVNALWTKGGTMYPLPMR